MSYSATLPPTEDMVKLQTICFWIHAFEHLWMKLPLFNWTQILSVLQQADNPLIRGDTLKEEVNTNPIAVLDGRSIHLRQREPTTKSGWERTNKSTDRLHNIQLSELFFDSVSQWKHLHDHINQFTKYNCLQFTDGNTVVRYTGNKIGITAWNNYCIALLQLRAIDSIYLICVNLILESVVGEDIEAFPATRQCREKHLFVFHLMESRHDDVSVFWKTTKQGGLLILHEFNSARFRCVMKCLFQVLHR